MKPRLSDVDFETAAALIGCNPAAIRAVCEVERPGSGFNPDDSPSTLFEGHKFFKFTNGKYATQYPSICYPIWDKSKYGKTWQEEQARLKLAESLDFKAAWQSASWGKFQIMGFNYGACGFTQILEFINAMKESELRQLQAFIEFVKTNHIDDELRRLDWAGFARFYNGPSYADNKYDTKLATAYAKYSK